MKQIIQLRDIKYFLKQKVLDQNVYMGVIEESQNTITVCMIKDTGNIKSGETAVVPKDTIVKRCQEGSCEIISPNDFNNIHSIKPLK